ncbi:MAG: prevent-host-death protein [Fibrobacterota bacterium]
MVTVSKGLLKAKMLEYFRAVEESGEELIVTDHRNPVLKVSPYKARKSVSEIFGDVYGKVRITGDLTEPTIGEWEELK